MSWLDKPDDGANIAWPKRIYYRIVIELFRSWLVRPIDVLLVLGTGGILAGLVFWPESWPMRGFYVACAAFLVSEVARGNVRRGSFRWAATGVLLIAAAFTIWTWL